jgi:hypothetical protein
MPAFGKDKELESQLPAADIKLSDDVLDRIDHIVPPGTNINPRTAGGSTRRFSRTARRR